jgi:hypothetical protein
MDEITPEKAQTSPSSTKRRNKRRYNEFCDRVVGFPSAEELPLAAVEFEFTRTVIYPLRHRSGHFDRSGTARPGAAHSSNFRGIISTPVPMNCQSFCREVQASQHEWSINHRRDWRLPRASWRTVTPLLVRLHSVSVKNPAISSLPSAI